MRHFLTVAFVTVLALAVIGWADEVRYQRLRR